MATSNITSNFNASGITFNSGTIVNVYSGGIFSYGYFRSGAILNLYNGAVASYTSFNTSPTTLNVYSGASAAGMVAFGGATFNVYTGAKLATGQIALGGVLNLSGGSYSGVTSTGPAGDVYGTVNIYSGGELSLARFSSTATLNVYENGIANRASITRNASAIIYSGGYAASTINFGNVYVSNGGTVNSTTVSNTGILTLSSGANLIDATIIASGVVRANSAAHLSGTINNAGIISGGTVYGTMNNSSGSIISGQIVVNGGNIIVNSGAYINGGVVSSGGNLTIISGGVLGSASVASAGNAKIYNNNGGLIDLSDGQTGNLVISGLENGGSATTVITGFDGTGIGNSDIITLAGVKQSEVTSVTYTDANHIVFTITKSDGTTNTITLNITGIQNSGYTLFSASDGSLNVEVCFLPGSMIKIPGGEIAVEKLCIGDSVFTYDWEKDKEVVRRVSWVGSKSTKVKNELPDDIAGYPIRILKDAIVKGVPYKDLLVTPEHCLFFNGQFVPVRMLVNGASIYYDYSIKEYTYYHIETEEHSVIWANGLLTESYLDTGNRAGFKQHGNVAILINKFSGTKSWENDGKAPLVVERSIIEPLYNQIVRHATQMGHEINQTKQLTTDPNLHLITKSGRIIKPHYRKDNHYSFILPENETVIYLKSRSNRPCDTIGPFIDDRRTLGVLIGNIYVHTKSDIYPVTEHFTSQDLKGWDVIENDFCRWTNGCAELKILHPVITQKKILTIKIIAAGPYLIEEEDLSQTNDDVAFRKFG